MLLPYGLVCPTAFVAPTSAAGSGNVSRLAALDPTVHFVRYRSLHLAAAQCRLRSPSYDAEGGTGSLLPLLAASALCHVSGGRSVLKKGSFPELRGGGASTTGTT